MESEVTHASLGKSAGLLGAHTSASGGVSQALLEGYAIGASTVQLFTSNQKRWEGKPIPPQEIANWQAALADTGLQQIMSHDSYLINLGSPREDILEKSRAAFGQEIERCLSLGLSFLNFHPGAALDQGREECLEKIIASLLLYESLLEGSQLTLLLETTAGQGSAVGSSFEELATIIRRVRGRIPIGVCVDTCHIFAAGYDIRTAEGWNQTLAEFDRWIGLDYLRAFHLNDSLKGLGSHVDRHQPLGEGLIGWECFQFLMRDPRTRPLSKYLETPGGPECWREEIKTLRTFL